MKNRTTRRWWVLGALSVCLLAVGFDLTILNVALPTLANELHASTSELQWVADSYNLVLAAMLLPAGMLGDRFGRKKLLLGALAVFGLASAGCAYSDSASMLIAMRSFLGIGAAFLIPLSMAMIPVLFEGTERTKAMMTWAVANMLGIPLGPILGGWLLKHYSWGSVFWINVPLVFVGFLAAAALMPESKSKTARPIDLPGVALSSIGLISVTYGVIRGGEQGWGTAIGIQLASRYPEKFNAYIGIAQIVNWAKSDTYAYEWLLRRATETRNQKALNQLRAIGKPPYLNVKDWNLLRKWLFLFGGFIYTDGANRHPGMPFMFKTMLKSPDYKLIDIVKSFVKGMKLAYSPRMLSDFSEYDAFANVKKLDVPVYFFHGKHDQAISGDLTERFFETLDAPKGKYFTWLNDSAHILSLEDSRVVERSILAIVL